MTLPSINNLLQHDKFKHFNHPVKEGLLLFMLLCYGRNSDLVKNQENLDERRKIASQMAKIEAWPEIINLEDPDFAELLDYYLCEVESHNTFQMMISCELTFREYQTHLRRPMKIKETIEEEKDGVKTSKEKIVMSQEDILKACETKGKLEELSEKTAIRIEKYRAEIYKVIDQETIVKAKRLRPENIAKK